jgi:hypothetical protein
VLKLLQEANYTKRNWNVTTACSIIILIRGQRVINKCTHEVPKNPQPNLTTCFLFCCPASCCACFITVIRRTVPRNNSSRCLCYILYILPLHVSALVGHLQVLLITLTKDMCFFLTIWPSSSGSQCADGATCKGGRGKLRQVLHRLPETRQSTSLWA